MERRRFCILGASLGAYALLQPLERAIADTPGRWFERATAMMGTFVSAAVYTSDAATGEKALSDCFAFAKERANEISDWESESSTSRLNAARELTKAELAPSFLSLLDLATEVARQSGTFCLQTFALTKLWREAREKRSLPSERSIAREAKLVRESGIELSSSHIRLLGAGSLEVGGIGKGHVVDLAADHLRSAGVKYGKVAGSGDIRFVGDTEWSVDIEHPRDESALLGRINFRGPKGVATSGDYRSCLQSHGKRYHHLIDCASGYPAPYCQSVTVVAPTAAIADGLSTAAFLMPPEQGVKFLERVAGVEGVIVSADGSIRSTSGASFQPYDKRSFRSRSSRRSC